VKFGGADSFDLTQNTPDDRSEAAEAPAPGLQTSLMQMPSVSMLTGRGGGNSDSKDRSRLQGHLQKSSMGPSNDLKDFSNYPQISVMRPMDGSYQAQTLNK
jgi:hypothetical protein